MSQVVIPLLAESLWWGLVLELASVGVEESVVVVAEACLSTRNTKPKLKQTTENLPKQKRVEAVKVLLCLVVVPVDVWRWYR